MSVEGIFEAPLPPDFPTEDPSVPDSHWSGADVAPTELSGTLYALKARATTRTVKGDLDGLE